MSTKAQVNKYIEMLEAIQAEFPAATAKIEFLIATIQDDYNDFIYKEIERQKLRKRESFAAVKQTEQFIKIDALNVGDFIVVPHNEKENYRRAKNAAASEYEDRKFTMRFVKGIGTILTRI